MTRPLFALFLAALLSPALLLSSPLPAGATALAQGSAETPAQAPAIRSVIESQLAALGRDDGVSAFAFASPTIRQKFQTPDNFMQMVRRHYAPVYQPSEISFRGLHPSPRGPVQEVLLVGSNGRAVMALYFMEQQPDGSWRINGVRLIDAPDLTT